MRFMDRIKETATIAESYRCIAGLCAFLFIFSLLKAFRFQPRLGLLTRTLEIVAPELFNYCILFLTIFGGFAVAATILFGHQVYKVSTVDKSVVFLVFLVRLLDPTQYWQQFSHSAPEWAFLLWVWSFIFIVVLGLFNVFLALLIEGYIRASAEKDSASTVTADLANLTQQTMKRIFMPSTSYMSDDRLKSYLDARKAGLPSANNLRNVIISHLDGDVDRSKTIALTNGVHIGFEELTGLIEISERTNTEENQYASLPRPAASDFPDEQNADMLSNSDVGRTVFENSSKERLVMELLLRYHADTEGENGDENDKLMEIFSLEHLLRKLVMFNGHSIIMEKVATMGNILVQMSKKMLPSAEYLNFVKKIQTEDESTTKTVPNGYLNVTVVGADNLPNLDLLSSIDAYCVLFVAPHSIQKVGFQCNASRTKVVKNTRAPMWMERFRFEISNHDKYFILTLFDSDARKNDKLVGCVVIRFRELRDGETVDTWFDLEMTQEIADRTTKQPRIHLQLRYTQRSSDTGPSLNVSSGDGGWAAT